MADGTGAVTLTPVARAAGVRDGEAVAQLCADRHWIGRIGDRDAEVGLVRILELERADVAACAGRRVAVP